MSYKVKKGDTLSGIAKAYNISLDKLLKLNGISKENAGKINIGQEIKVTSEGEEPKYPLFSAKFPVSMNWKDSIAKTAPSPYKPDYTQEQYLKDNAKSIQKQLLAENYDLGKWGADGKWGKSSQAALDKALADGYKLQNGKLIAPTKAQFIPANYQVGLVKHVQGQIKPEEIENAWEQVQNDPEFFQYLYTSGGEGKGRRLANVVNVAGNYVYGMINPDGNTPFDLGDGSERQAVAAALYNRSKGQTGITDSAHEALGGFGNNTKHSGEEFREDDNQGFAAMVKKYIKQAADAPYHNIYGQSSEVSFTDKGFESPSDNYTYNNIWSGDKVIKVMEDGEGSMSLRDSIQSGKDARSSGASLKAAMETAATNRGVNTKRHSDVSLIPRETLNAWANEYLRQKKQ